MLSWGSQRYYKCMSYRLLVATLFIAASLCNCTTAGDKVHGVSIFGPESLKYAEDEPFEYLATNAPISGTLRLPGGYFSKTTPFGLSGNLAPGVWFCFDRLGLKSWDDDEPYAMYGLLVKYYELADDRNSMRLYLRPEARFSDGVPLTADDVVFSYNLLYDPDMNPADKLRWKNVETLTKIDDHTVEIRFKEYNRDVPIWISYLVVYPKHVYGVPGVDLSKDFEDSFPVGSGPYAMESVVKGQRVTLRRRKDYWGDILPRSRGHRNYERMDYMVYYDSFSKLEAFKSGLLDYCGMTLKEFVKLKGDYFDKGYIRAETFPLTRPSAMFGLVFNLRNPLFQDIRIRRVITSLYDTDYINRNVYYGHNERLVSYFHKQRRIRATTGPATGKVRDILLDLAGRFNDPENGTVHVPEEAFTRGPYQIGTDADGNLIPIEDRMQAANLYLDSIGWAWDPALKARRKGKQLLRFEIVQESEAGEEAMRIVEVLQQVGIDATITRASPLEYTNRRKSFRFDMISGWFDGRHAPGHELARNFLSKEADVRGSANIMGLKNPAVDEVLNILTGIEDREKMEVYARVFDRIMCANIYVLPATWPKHDIGCYWAYLKQPKKYCSGLWYVYNVQAYWWVDKEAKRAIEKAKAEGKPYVRPE